MASVTALANRVAAVTGLSETGDDRALVLEYLNQAYAYSVLETGAYIATFSKALTTGVADYTIGTAPLDITGVLEFRSLWIDDAAIDNRPLDQVSEAQLLAMRNSVTIESTPLFYALRGTRQVLLYPAPAEGTTLLGSYLSEPPELVESAPTASQETTPTAIPSPFHFDVIANKATALALEYDNRFEEAAAYDAKWGVALERLLAWVSRFGGPTISTMDTDFMGPRDRDTGL